jgi:uncharacterized protein YqeY
MSIKQQLSDDLKDAMRKREDLRRDVLRFTLAALHNAEIAERKELDDDAALAVLTREAKRRKESIEEFGKGGRQDLVEKEEAELAILAVYLPEQLSREEIVQAARDAIAQTGATGLKELGKVMQPLMQQLRGRAGGKEVTDIVRELLGGS